jgi:hypothetical protein
MTDKCKKLDLCHKESASFHVHQTHDKDDNVTGGWVDLWPILNRFERFHDAFEIGMAEAVWRSYQTEDGRGWKFSVFTVGERYGDGENPQLTVDFPWGFDVHDVTVTDDNTGKMYKLVPVNGQVADGIDNHWYQSGFETGQREMANYLHSRATEHMCKK